MKSEFIIAFNEICEQRNLSKDVVFDALKTALVSAYRRNTNVSNSQQVTAEIDRRTGEPTILAEKEVVESIIDDRTEVLYEHAINEGFTDVQLGDIIMINSTPADFGRIAAQTAKQVILQRVREAEREQLFEDFSTREGELINGSVQSISNQHVTIGLGRTEAILPKNQQVHSERYRTHDKLRVYVLEVRRTSRGPQIFVSRSHRNLLRRLLELEVPEIYNGQVEIKNIAREAGARSKVAVMALQAGIDPVGACVGMRGVRIQSIVRELNDEKIDVIEWDTDPRSFIAKALSPARVAQVFLEEPVDDGKTAIVVVPDDQLSLAIGREGQNARLAAKLTGWRIDIKSMTETAADGLNLLSHPDADPAIIKDTEFIEQIKFILAKKANRRPITAEDNTYLNRFLMGTEGRIIAKRNGRHEIMRSRHKIAHQKVAEEAWTVPMVELDLPDDIYDVLADNEVDTLGDIMFHLALGDEHVLAMPGFNASMLPRLKKAVSFGESAPKPQIVVPAAEVVAPVVTPTAVTEPTIVAEEIIVEPVQEEAEDIDFATEIDASFVDQEPVWKEKDTDDVPVVADESAEIVSLEPLPIIDELQKSIIEKEPTTPEKPIVIFARPTEPAVETDDDADKKGSKNKKRELVFDEDSGRVVSRRKHKNSRRANQWLDDLDDESF